MSDIWSASSLYVVLFFILLKVGISSPFEALSKCFIESARVKRETRLLCASQIKLRGCAILIQSIISDSESFNHLLQLMTGFDLCPVQLGEEKKHINFQDHPSVCSQKCHEHVISFLSKSKCVQKGLFSLSRSTRDDHSAYILDNEVVRLNWRV